MIVVTVQYVDQSGALYNGGFAQHFYNLNEAKTFARNESATYPGTNVSAFAVFKVYNDGEIVEAWRNGVEITG